MGYAGVTDISKCESYVLEDGDLLMSHINSVQYLGRTVLYVKEADETIIHGMNLLRLKARRDVINPAYARYCFYGYPFKNQIGKITKKSVNQASFAVKDLKQIKIEVPSLSEQDKIVKILDKLKKIIEMRNDELATLEDLIKSQFAEMFGDPLKNENAYQRFQARHCSNYQMVKHCQTTKDLTQAFLFMVVMEFHGTRMKFFAIMTQLLLDV